MRAVLLLDRHGCNNPGEVCGFDDVEAAQLIQAGRAVPVPSAPEAPAASTPGPFLDKAVPAPPADKMVQGAETKRPRGRPRRV